MTPDAAYIVSKTRFKLIKEIARLDVFKLSSWFFIFFKWAVYPLSLYFFVTYRTPSTSLRNYIYSYKLLKQPHLWSWLQRKPLYVHWQTVSVCVNLLLMCRETCVAWTWATSFLPPFSIVCLSSSSSPLNLSFIYLNPSHIRQPSRCLWWCT